HKARPFKSYKKNYLGRHTMVVNELDFRGKPTQSETIHKRNSSGVEVSIKDYLAYDGMERPESHHQSINNSVRNLIADSEYNRLGQLQTKYVGGVQSKIIDRWQKIDYTYNIRGWLTNINQVYELTAGDGTVPPSVYDDLFAFQIRYNNPSSEGEALYNGNISQ